MFSSSIYKKFPFQNNLPFMHSNLFLNDTSVYIKVKVGIYEEPQEYTQIQIKHKESVPFLSFGARG